MARTLTFHQEAPLLCITPQEAEATGMLDWALVAGMLVAAPLLYSPLLVHNLPVASGLDEGNALEVLGRFHHGSLNPEFFQYPTLYFYVVYALLLPLHYSNVHALLAGRMFDLVLIGVIAGIAYAFCRDRLRSRTAGCIAAALLLCSPILSDMVYLHPDLLMTATGTGALYFWWITSQAEAAERGRSAFS